MEERDGPEDRPGLGGWREEGAEVGVWGSQGWLRGATPHRSRVIKRGQRRRRWTGREVKTGTNTKQKRGRNRPEMGIRLPDLATENTVGSVRFEFHI